VIITWNADAIMGIRVKSSVSIGMCQGAVYLSREKKKSEFRFCMNRSPAGFYLQGYEGSLSRVRCKWIDRVLHHSNG
jgi:hypothetical protein